MSSRTYNEILNQAKKCTTSVQDNYKLGINSKWSYFFAKAIIKPKTNVNRIDNFKEASKPTGTHISRQISKNDYLDMAKRLIKYCETNKKLPNYIRYGDYKIRTRLYCLMFAKVLVSYSKNNKLPDKVNVNSKAFTKQIETTNTIYDAFIKLFGKVTTCTDVMKKIQGKGYGYYFDDVLSNLEVITGLKNSNGKKPNCVDICQMVWNVLIGLGYDVRCLQVYCPVDKITHVRLQVKHPKHTNGKWEDYDPAAVADGGSINSLWCSGAGSYLIATNPNWFMANLLR